MKKKIIIGGCVVLAILAINKCYTIRKQVLEHVELQKETEIK